MITGFLIQILVAIVSFILNLLPIYAFPSQWLSALSLVFGYANSVGYLFPFSTLFTILGIAVFLHTTLFLWHLTQTLYHWLRGI